MWKQRSLSIKGKITILKSKIIPLFLYTASVMYISEEIVTKFEKIMYSFIWPKGKHHVKKNILTQTIEKGGLNMPDAESLIWAAKLTWIKRLLQRIISHV